MIKKKKILASEDLPEFQASIDAMPADSKIFVDKSLQIARYIFYLMEQKGMKQRDLAEAMGKTEAEVSKILGGMHNLTLRSIAKLEAALESIIVVVPKIEKAVFTEAYKYETASRTEITSKVEKEEPSKMDYNAGCRVIEMKKSIYDKKNMTQAI